MKQELSARQMFKFIEGLKAGGKTEEDILNMFLAEFTKGEITIDELEASVKCLGYDLNPDIKKHLIEHPEEIGLTKEYVKPNKINKYFKDCFAETCKMLKEQFFMGIPSLAVKTLCYRYGYYGDRKPHTQIETARFLGKEYTAKDVQKLEDNAISFLKSDWNVNKKVIDESYLVEMFQTILYLYNNDWGYVSYRSYVNLFADEELACFALMIIRLVSTYRDLGIKVIGKNHYQTFIYSPKMLAVSSIGNFYRDLFKDKTFATGECEINNNDREYFETLLNSINTQTPLTADQKNNLLKKIK